ncbi:uncharacterized protein LOC141600948 [Silene latifolia]|uniref:uncharacterized protein LOC141600948 n=1 Tax=Silene latifolia TaxID=37657 RepID=UPI003D76BD23
MFVLPKGVLDRVDAICRTFLWEGSTVHNKAPLIAWSKVCVPKKEGGLGLKNSHKWNIALIGKLVWWIAAKPDKLWVQWIHHVYLNNVSWQYYCPPPDISWYWRKICQVRDLLAEGFSDNVWSIGEDGYSVQSCYNWVRDKQPDVLWSKAIWSHLAVPKHSFIAWLIAHNALMLKNRLFQYGIATDNLCCICHSQTEDLSHLFHGCSFSRQVMQELGKWLCSDFTHAQTFVRIARRRWGRIRKEVCTAAVIATWYFIWQQRNEARLFNRVMRPVLVIKNVQQAIRMRFVHYHTKSVSSRDRSWLVRVHLMSN